MKIPKYLTADMPGTGGVIKETPEDFCVSEIPLYLPCGEGEHTYVEIEKRGVTTLEAIRRMARALNAAEREIGYAGMKDARGVTRQTVSIPRVTPEAAVALELPGIRVLSARRHGNKLRLGHLAGNRFAIRVRGTVADGEERAAAIIDVLKRRGVPNCFGLQRFGSQANSHLVGRAWVLGDYRAAVDLLIGSGEGITDEQWRGAIAAYREGDLEQSVRLFPSHCRTEREIVQRLKRKPDNWRQSLGGVPSRLKALYVSAFQSYIFNRVLDGRLDRFDCVMDGDLAYKHANGACFLVEDAAAEAERARSMEISPTGPMPGARMMLPQGVPLALEDEVLRQEGLDRSSLYASELLPAGERRPLRVPLDEPVLAADNEGLHLTFSLPRGAYATAVLREILKSEAGSLS
jgi:tRNA pseudouridine13 synthase